MTPEQRQELREAARRFEEALNAAFTEGEKLSVYVRQASSVEVREFGGRSRTLPGKWEVEVEISRNEAL